MTTLQAVELGFWDLGLHGGSVVSADTLVELLWGHLTNRCEVFEEADLDVAIARLDDLDRLASS